MRTKKIDRFIFCLVAIIIIIFSANIWIKSKDRNCFTNDNCNWAEYTKQTIDDLIEKKSGLENTYVVFDWDNTCIYSDVQENLFVYQLENLVFKITPAQFKYAFSHYCDADTKTNIELPKVNFSENYKNTANGLVKAEMLMDDCYNDYKFLFDNFRLLNPNSKGNLTLEEIKNSDQYKDFRAKLFFTYSALYDSFPSNVSYTWVLYVTAVGFTSEEIKTLAEKSIDWGIKSPIEEIYFDSPESLPGKTGMISNTGLNNPFRSGIKTIPEITGLFKTLRDNKIEVFICSASLQDVVEVFAENPKYGYELPANHVLGMRLNKDTSGRFIAEYDFADYYTVNGGEGKTININNILVKRYKSNPIMIAGDSNGDYPMITQFSGLDGSPLVNNFEPLQLVLIMNRLKKGKIGALCEIAVRQLENNSFSETIIVLQGRDENSGCWIPSEKTLKFGFKGEDYLKLLP